RYYGRPQGSDHVSFVTSTRPHRARSSPGRRRSNRPRPPRWVDAPRLADPLRLLQTVVDAKPRDLHLDRLRFHVILLAGWSGALVEHRSLPLDRVPISEVVDPDIAEGLDQLG